MATFAAQAAFLTRRTARLPGAAALTLLTSLAVLPALSATAPTVLLAIVLLTVAVALTATATATVSAAAPFGRLLRTRLRPVAAAVISARACAALTPAMAWTLPVTTAMAAWSPYDFEVVLGFGFATGADRTPLLWIAVTRRRGLGDILGNAHRWRAV